MTVLLKPRAGGRPIVVDKPILLIGRHPDCDIIIESSPKVSRQHCCVARVDERCIVRDLESMNGVWVNGDRVTASAEVVPGDVLMIGDVQFDVINSNGKVAAPIRRDSAQPSQSSSSGPSKTVPMPDKPELYDEAMLRSTEGSEAIKFSPSLNLSDVESGDDYVLAEVDN